MSYNRRSGVSVKGDDFNPKAINVTLPNGSTQKLMFVTKYESELYDTVNVPVGAVAAGTSLEFFRDLNGKNLIDSNMSSSRKLLAGSAMRVFFVGLYFPQAGGNTEFRFDDVKKIVDNAIIEVKLNDVEIAKGPAYRFPIGYGLTGNSTRTDFDVFHLGVPSTAAVRPLATPVWITEQHDLQAQIRFDNRAGWASGVGMPTLMSNTHVRLVLKGIYFK